MDLNISTHDGIITSKSYDKPDDFDFDIVNFPFSDGDIPCTTSYGVMLAYLIC